MPGIDRVTWGWKASHSSSTVCGNSSRLLPHGAVARRLERRDLKAVVCRL